MQYRSLGFFCKSQGYNNNRCSGYALAFIISEIFSHRNCLIECRTKDKDLGMYFYDKLSVCQKKLLKRCVAENPCIRFISTPANIAGGTYIILPSSIVHYCSSLGLLPTIFYSSERSSVFQTEIFEEDCKRMTDFLCLVSRYDEFERWANKYQYLLALTRYQHWVALKSTKEGYYLFDPAPKEYGGGVFGPEAFKTILPKISKKYSSRYFYDILIGIYPKKY